METYSIKITFGGEGKGWIPRGDSYITEKGVVKYRVINNVLQIDKKDGSSSHYNMNYVVYFDVKKE